MKGSVFFIVSLLLFSMILFLTSEQKTNGPGGIQRGDSRIEGLKVTTRQKGLTDWVLTAGRADIAADGERADLSNIEVMVEQGGVTVIAEKGRYGLTDGSFSIEGGIIARGRTYTVSSETADFSSATGNLKAEGLVTIKAEKFTVTGSDMVFDQKNQTLRLGKNVTALFYN